MRQWGRHKGREWQEVIPSFPALRNKTHVHTHTGLTWVVEGTVCLSLRNGAQVEIQLLWAPSARRHSTSNVKYVGQKDRGSVILQSKHP